MKLKNIGFIGLGLIGGSIAQKIKANHPDCTIIATAGRQATITEACSMGLIANDTLLELSAFGDCDIIFLCAPVEKNLEYLHQLKDIVKPDCLITDVGSTKTQIHKEVISLGLEKQFIGGHPMTGSEKTGISNANIYLLENAYYIITPTASTTEAQLNEFYQFVKELGSIPLILDYEAHDYATASISHLPHMIAYTLVNLVKDIDDEKETMKTIAAGGFKDITRIASSSAEVWSQICYTNKEQISLVLGKYINYLVAVKDMIDSENKEGIFKMFSDSKEFRDSIGINNGPIIRNYTLYCDIEDKEGALSNITLLLSDNHISIKNIEIIHNREYSDGVLQISFYDELSRTSARNILSEKGYFIHR